MKTLFTSIALLCCYLATAQELKRAYFMTTAGNPKYLTYQQDTIEFSLNPKPIVMHSYDGGKTVMFSLGKYWLEVDTNQSNTIVLSPDQPNSNTLYALWKIEVAASPSSAGFTFSIKSALPGKNYYLNSANYEWLNLADTLDYSIGEGCYWQFFESSAHFNMNQLVHIGNFTFGPTSGTQKNPVQNPDSILFYDGEQFSLQPNTVGTYLWHWQLEKDADSSSYEITITNEQNEQYYVVREIDGACGLKTDSSRMFVGPKNRPVHKGWVPGFINLEEPMQIGLWTTSEPFDCNGCEYVDAIKISDKGMTCSTSNVKNPVTVAVSEFKSVNNTQQYFVHEAFQTLKAEKKIGFPNLKGRIVQDLAYRNIGSNEYYIYGDQQQINVLKRNPYFPSSNASYTYKSDGKHPINGASLNDSYLYIAYNDSIRLFSLFGLDNAKEGLLSQTYGGKQQLSAPVYNPISHQVFALNEQGYVVGFGQGLKNYLSPYVYPHNINVDSTELFVLPEKDTLTHLYFINSNDSLVRLLATANTIQIDGKPQAVTPKEIEWFRYQTKMLNYKSNVKHQEIVPINNGHVVKGAIGTDSTYVIMFIKDSLLKATKVSLYVGPKAAFPTFSNTDSLSVPLLNGTTSSLCNWILQDDSGNNLWGRGYPIVFYNEQSQSFAVETLASLSAFEKEASVYAYSFPLDSAKYSATLLNIEWQRAKGNIQNIKFGTPLDHLFQFYWMKNYSP